MSTRLRSLDVFVEHGYLDRTGCPPETTLVDARVSNDRRNGNPRALISTADMRRAIVRTSRHGRTVTFAPVPHGRGVLLEAPDRRPVLIAIDALSSTADRSEIAVARSALIALCGPDATPAVTREDEEWTEESLDRAWTRIGWLHDVALSDRVAHYASTGRMRLATEEALGWARIDPADRDAWKALNDSSRAAHWWAHEGWTPDTAPGWIGEVRPDNVGAKALRSHGWHPEDGLPLLAAIEAAGASADAARQWATLVDPERRGLAITFVLAGLEPDEARDVEPSEMAQIRAMAALRSASPEA